MVEHHDDFESDIGSGGSSDQQGSDFNSTEEAVSVTKYKNNDQVEVWSNSFSQWCPGIVDHVERNFVHVSYVTPDGGSLTKQLPENHTELRLVTGVTRKSSTNHPVLTSKYKISDRIEVWSNTYNQWRPGIVERVEGKTVNVEYETPDGDSLAKRLPDDHEHLRLVAAGVSAESVRSQPAPATKYKVNDRIEVWSNSYNQWRPGTVERVEGKTVHVEYETPEGDLLAKKLPHDHEHLRLVTGVPTERSKTEVHYTAKYKIYDRIEVWSKSSNEWRPGTVERVEGNTVYVEYVAPGGGALTKQVPDDSDHLRLAASASATSPDFQDGRQSELWMPPKDPAALAAEIEIAREQWGDSDDRTDAAPTKDVSAKHGGDTDKKQAAAVASGTKEPDEDSRMSELWAPQKDAETLAAEIAIMKEQWGDSDDDSDHDTTERRPQKSAKTKDSPLASPAQAPAANLDLDDKESRQSELWVPPKDHATLAAEIEIMREQWGESDDDSEAKNKGPKNIAAQRNSPLASPARSSAAQPAFDDKDSRQSELWAPPKDPAALAAEIEIMKEQWGDSDNDSEHEAKKTRPQKQKSSPLASPARSSAAQPESDDKEQDERTSELWVVQKDAATLAAEIEIMKEQWGDSDHDSEYAAKKKSHQMAAPPKRSPVASPARSSAAQPESDDKESRQSELWAPLRDPSTLAEEIKIMRYQWGDSDDDGDSEASQAGLQKASDATESPWASVAQLPPNDKEPSHSDQHTRAVRNRDVVSRRATLLMSESDDDKDDREEGDDWKTFYGVDDDDVDDRIDGDQHFVPVWNATQGQDSTQRIEDQRRVRVDIPRVSTELGLSLQTTCWPPKVQAIESGFEDRWEAQTIKEGDLLVEVDGIPIERTSLDQLNELLERRPLVLVFLHSRANLSPRANIEEIAGSWATCNVEQFLHPPDPITEVEGQKMRKLAQAMLDFENHTSSVFLTFAEGKRPQDAGFFGPGVYYAAAVTRILYDVGIPCFSALMLPPGVPRRVVSEQIGAASSSCKVLLVIQTKALYDSIDCLQEIYHAQRNRITIFPLRFESELPKFQQEWPQITRSDTELMVMLAEVLDGFCKLNSIPSPPYTVVDHPEVLEDVVADLRRKLGLPSGPDIESNQASPPPASDDTGLLTAVADDTGDWPPFWKAGGFPHLSNTLKATVGPALPEDTVEPIILAENGDEGIRVFIDSARGFTHVSGGLFCSCEIVGREKGRFSTRVTQEKEFPTWYHVREIFGYTAGDLLRFAAWSLHADGRSEVLAEVYLQPVAFYPKGFHGELHLEPRSHSFRRSGPLAIRVQIDVVSNNADEASDRDCDLPNLGFGTDIRSPEPKPRIDETNSDAEVPGVADAASSARDSGSSSSGVLHVIANERNERTTHPGIPALNLARISSRVDDEEDDEEQNVPELPLGKPSVPKLPLGKLSVPKLPLEKLSVDKDSRQSEVWAPPKDAKKLEEEVAIAKLNWIDSSDDDTESDSASAQAARKSELWAPPKHAKKLAAEIEIMKENWGDRDSDDDSEDQAELISPARASAAQSELDDKDARQSELWAPPKDAKKLAEEVEIMKDNWGDRDSDDYSRVSEDQEELASPARALAAQYEWDDKEKDVRDKAALKIQKVRRGQVGRKAAEQMKREKKKEKEVKEKAALKIQKMRRGQVGRKAAEQMKREKKKEMRFAEDGKAYTRQQFLTFFGEQEGQHAWDRARQQDMFSRTLAPKKSSKETVVGGMSASEYAEATNLTLVAKAGDMKLDVASTVGFLVGQRIIIAPGTPFEEVNEIEAFGSILLKYPLQYDHDVETMILKAFDKPPLQSATQRRTTRLRVLVIGAQCLRAAVSTGSQPSAYCICEIVSQRDDPEAISQARFRTPTVHNQQNPTWNFVYSFAQFEIGNYVRFRLWDEGDEGSVATEMLGESVVSTDQMYPSGFVGDLLISPDDRLQVGAAKLRIKIDWLDAAFHQQSTWRLASTPPWEPSVDAPVRAVYAEPSGTEKVDAGSAVVVVTIVRARGLRSFDLMEKMTLMCTCEIIGKPRSKFRTPAISNVAEPIWKYQQSVNGWKVGDSLHFVVRASRAPGSSEDVCHAVLGSTRFFPQAFEGELQLASKGLRTGRMLAKLEIKVEVPTRPQVTGLESAPVSSLSTLQVTHEAERCPDRAREVGLGDATEATRRGEQAALRDFFRCENDAKVKIEDSTANAYRLRSEQEVLQNELAACQALWDEARNDEHRLERIPVWRNRVEEVAADAKIEEGEMYQFELMIKSSEASIRDELDRAENAALGRPVMQADDQPYHLSEDEIVKEANAVEVLAERVRLMSEEAYEEEEAIRNISKYRDRLPRVEEQARSTQRALEAQGTARRAAVLGLKAKRAEEVVRTVEQQVQRLAFEHRRWQAQFTVLQPQVETINDRRETPLNNGEVHIPESETEVRRQDGKDDHAIVLDVSGQLEDVLGDDLARLGYWLDGEDSDEDKGELAEFAEARDSLPSEEEVLAPQIPTTTSPTADRIASMSLKVHNVDFEALSDSKALLDAFTKAVKETFVDEAASGISAEHIQVTLTAGSVIIHAIITPPADYPNTTSSLQSQMRNSLKLPQSMAANLQNVPGIEAVADGVITVSNFFTPIVDDVATPSGTGQDDGLVSKDPDLGGLSILGLVSKDPTLGLESKDPTSQSGGLFDASPNIDYFDALSSWLDDASAEVDQPLQSDEEDAPPEPTSKDHSFDRDTVGVLTDQRDKGVDDSSVLRDERSDTLGIGKLRVLIARAQDLLAWDWRLDASPFCSCEIIGKPASVFHTRTIRNNRNPVWQHVHELSPYESGDAIRFAVWDERPQDADVLMGDAILWPEQFDPGGYDGLLKLVCKEWRAGSPEAVLRVGIDVIQTQSTLVRQPLFHKAQSANLPGSMQTSFLKVTVGSARGLESVEVTGKLDAYCTCELIRRPKTKFFTHVRSSFDPVWDHSHEYKDYLVGDSLFFAVWHEGYDEHDQLLGDVTLAATDFYPNGYLGNLNLRPRGRVSPSQHAVLRVRVDVGEEAAKQLEAIQSGTFLRCCAEEAHVFKSAFSDDVIDTVPFAACVIADESPLEVEGCEMVPIRPAGAVMLSGFEKAAAAELPDHGWDYLPSRGGLTHSVATAFLREKEKEAKKIFLGADYASAKADLEEKARQEREQKWREELEVKVTMDPSVTDELTLRFLNEHNIEREAYIVAEIAAREARWQKEAERRNWNEASQREIHSLKQDLAKLKEQAAERKNRERSRHKVEVADAFQRVLSKERDTYEKFLEEKRAWLELNVLEDKRRSLLRSTDIDGITEKVADLRSDLLLGKWRFPYHEEEKEQLPPPHEDFNGLWVLKSQKSEYSIIEQEKADPITGVAQMCIEVTWLGSARTYQLRRTGKSRCIAEVEGKKVEGEITHVGRIHWKNGSTWVVKGFDGAWKNTSSGWVHSIEGSILRWGEDGAVYDFDGGEDGSCTLEIDGDLFHGDVYSHGRILWSNGARWHHQDFVGTWEKAGRRSRFFVRGAELHWLDSGAVYEIHGIGDTKCSLELTEETRWKGTLNPNGVLSWSNNMDWVCEEWNVKLDTTWGGELGLVTFPIVDVVNGKVLAIVVRGILENSVAAEWNRKRPRKAIRLEDEVRAVNNRYHHEEIQQELQRAQVVNIWIHRKFDGDEEPPEEPPEEPKITLPEPRIPKQDEADEPDMEPGIAGGDMPEEVDPISLAREAWRVRQAKPITLLVTIVSARGLRVEPNASGVYCIGVVTSRPTKQLSTNVVPRIADQEPKWNYTAELLECFSGDALKFTVWTWDGKTARSTLGNAVVKFSSFEDGFFDDRIRLQETGAGVDASVHVKIKVQKDLFSGRWKRDGIPSQYIVKGSKVTFLADEKSKAEETYKFKVRSEDACAMRVDGDVYEGNLMTSGKLQWNNKSVWIREGFDGSWKREGTQERYIINGEDVLIVSSGIFLKFRPEGTWACWREHQHDNGDIEVRFGQTTASGKIEWEKYREIWVRDGFDGRWEKEGWSKYLIDGNRVLASSGTAYPFQARHERRCIMTMPKDQYKGDLVKLERIKWSNGSAWVRRDPSLYLNFSEDIPEEGLDQTHIEQGIDTGFDAERRENAALMVQRAWRGKQARKWFYIMRIRRLRRWLDKRRARKLISELRKAYYANKEAAKAFRAGDMLKAIFPGDGKVYKAVAVSVQYAIGTVTVDWDKLEEHHRIIPDEFVERAPRVFEVGDNVEARFGGNGVWCAAEVVAINADGTINVDWEDDLKDAEKYVTVAASELHKLPRVDSDSDDDAQEHFAVGDLVEAKSAVDDKYHEAQVVQVHLDGSVTVDWCTAEMVSCHVDAADVRKGGRFKLIVGSEVDQLGFIWVPPPGKVFITEVLHGTWAYRSGLRAGAAIVTINAQEVKTMLEEDFSDALKQRPLHLTCLLPTAPVPVVPSSHNQETASLALSCTVHNVVFLYLSNDFNLLVVFKQKVKEAIAYEAGAAILPEHVKVELSEGALSTSIQAEVTPPSSASVAVAESLLVASNTLGQTIVETLDNIPGIEAVVAGHIAVSEIVVGSHKNTAEQDKVTKDKHDNDMKKKTDKGRHDAKQRHEDVGFFGGLLGEADTDKQESRKKKKKKKPKKRDAKNENPRVSQEPMPAHKFAIGDNVRAKHASDGKSYAAKIVSINDALTATVEWEFLEEGKSEARVLISDITRTCKVDVGDLVEARFMGDDDFRYYLANVISVNNDGTVSVAWQKKETCYRSVPALQVRRDETYATLSVEIVSARGLLNTDLDEKKAALRHSDPFCICSIANQPTRNTIKTPVLENTEDPVWNFKGTLAGYSLDDALEFSVWDNDADGSKESLGQVLLETSLFYYTGFDGELPLLGAGKGANAFLKVRVNKLFGPDVEVQNVIAKTAEFDLGFSSTKPPGRVFVTEVEPASWAEQNGILPGSEMVSVYKSPPAPMTAEIFKDVMKRRELPFVFLPPNSTKEQTDAFQEALKVQQLEQDKRDGKYDIRIRSRFFVEIIKAESLRKADLFSKSDPYATCEVVGDPASQARTAAVDNTQDPVWNHTFEFPYFCTDGDSLEFTVWDSDSKRPDVLGRGRLLFKEFKNGFEGEFGLTEAGSAKDARLWVKVTCIPTYEPGDYVVAVFKADGQYHDAVVASVNLDGTITVDWDMVECHHRTLPDSDVHKFPRKFKIGENVEAMLDTNGSWNDAEIVTVNSDGTVVVKWDSQMFINIDGTAGTENRSIVLAAHVHQTFEQEEEGRQHFAVEISSATGLLNVDFGGHSDPFCVCEIAGNPKLQTHVVENTENPVWNHKGLLSNVLSKDVLEFSVWDQDEAWKEPLGKAQLPSRRFYAKGFEGELEMIGAGAGTDTMIQLKVRRLAPPKKGKDKLVVGDPVEALYAGTGEIHEGVVARIQGTGSVTIDWCNGATDHRTVAYADVRKGGRFEVFAHADVEDLGLELEMPPGDVFVNNVEPDSWAEDCGLQVDNVVVVANGKEVREMSPDELVDILDERPLILICVPSLGVGIDILGKQHVNTVEDAGDNEGGKTSSVAGVALDNEHNEDTAESDEAKDVDAEDERSDEGMFSGVSGTSDEKPERKRVQKDKSKGERSKQEKKAKQDNHATVLAREQQSRDGRGHESNIPMAFSIGAAVNVKLTSDGRYHKATILSIDDDIATVHWEEEEVRAAENEIVSVASMVRICKVNVGEKVEARFHGDKKYYMAWVSSIHNNGTVTVDWGKMESCHRTVLASQVKKNERLADLLVEMISARGLLKTDLGEKKSKQRYSDPFCICGIVDKPRHNTIETQIVSNTQAPVWNFRSVLKGYALEDTLEFSIWDKDQEHDKERLGWARLETSLFYYTGFEGDLPLLGAGKGSNGYVSVKVEKLIGPEVALLHVTADAESPADLGMITTKPLGRVFVTGVTVGGWADKQGISEGCELITVNDGKKHVARMNPAAFDDSLKKRELTLSFLPAKSTAEQVKAFEAAKKRQNKDAGDAIDSQEEKLGFKVTIISAQKLRNADITSKSDPYVTCEVAGRPNSQARTPVLHNALNPVWNHEFPLVFKCTDGDELQFTVWDQDTKVNDDLLGSHALNFEEFKNGFEGEFGLREAGKAQNARLKVKVELVKLAEEIKIPIKVTVVGAQHLRKADALSLSDAFCVCEVLGQPDLTFTTSTRQDSRDPLWNKVQKLVSYVKGNTLKFSVWDQDEGKSRDPLGVVELQYVQFGRSGFEGSLPLKEAKERSALRVKVDLLKLEDIEGENDAQEENRDEENMVLQVIIRNAKNLRSADLVNQSDPFCVCEIQGASEEAEQIFKTPVKDNTNNPEWNYELPELVCRKGSPLSFSVYDKDIRGEDFLGRASLQASQFCPQGFKGDLMLQIGEGFFTGSLGIDVNVLEIIGSDGLPMEDVFPTKPKNTELQGSLGVRVSIISAIGLRAADSTGLSDPFCTCFVVGKADTMITTPVINNTRDPEWGFISDISQCRGADDTLQFHVWDSDPTGQDSLGRASLAASRYYPNGFSGDLVLEDAGDGIFATLKVAVDILWHPLQKFQGRWTKEGNREYVIKDAKVRFLATQEHYRLRLEGATKCTMDVQDGSNTLRRRGTLDKTATKIHWDQFSDWVRDPRYVFSGNWTDKESGLKFIIEAKRVRSLSEGINFRFQSKGVDSCTLIDDLGALRGDLVNNSRIEWGDGKVWLRQGFDGRWEDDGWPTFEIRWDQVEFMHTGDGVTHTFEIEGENMCSIELDGEEIDGELVAEDRIEWSNGTAWVLEGRILNKRKPALKQKPGVAFGGKDDAQGDRPAFKLNLDQFKEAAASKLRRLDEMRSRRKRRNRTNIKEEDIQGLPEMES